MVCSCCVELLKRILTEKGYRILHISLGSLTLDLPPDSPDAEKLKNTLQKLGFPPIEDKEEQLVENIKASVIELIHHYNNSNSLLRNSDFLVEKLGFSYPYLSSVFSRKENITLEKFIIFHKIEKVKHLIEEEDLSLSEIAFMMGYGNANYLSSQFKNVTGVTISEFRKDPGSFRKSLHQYSEKS